MSKKLNGHKDAIGDTNKPRLSLIPEVAIWEMGKAFTYGEKHYGTHNYREGLYISYLLDAALRHILRFSKGENIDENGAHALGCAMADLAIALEMYYNMPEADDRYIRKPKKTKKRRKKK